MNKFVLGIAIVAIIAIVLGTASYAAAKSPSPLAPADGTNEFGMMRGRGAYATNPAAGVGLTGVPGEDEVIHTELLTVFAEKLGISVEELDTRLAAGETLSQIAVSLGMTIDEFQTLLQDARLEALDLALLNGTITQEQYDLMMESRFARLSKMPNSRAGVNNALGYGERGSIRNQRFSLGQTAP